MVMGCVFYGPSRDLHCCRGSEPYMMILSITSLIVDLIWAQPSLLACVFMRTVVVTGRYPCFSTTCSVVHRGGSRPKIGDERELIFALLGALDDTQRHQSRCGQSGSPSHTCLACNTSAQVESAFLTQAIFPEMPKFQTQVQPHRDDKPHLRGDPLPSC